MTVTSSKPPRRGTPKVAPPEVQVEDYTYCPVCKADRETATLTDGICPICQSDTTPKAAPAFTKRPTPTTPDAERLASEEEAYRMPYDAPQSVLDPSPEREIASRTLCRRRLMPFIKKFRPKYTAGWVHEDICRRLEQFVLDVAAGKEPRLLLMMPPRSGKSEIGSRHFPAWVLGQYPEWEIIAASHTSSLTMSFSRYVRDLMRDPAYTAIFPSATLDRASQSVENWNILGGGGYLAAGVGTGITGRGAHILLLDDLVKDMEAADSTTIRDNTWEWYASTAYTRLAPGGGVIGIMTWWHDDDWAGRIQQVMESGDGDKFEIIRYPAINDKGDEYILDGVPHRPIVQVPPEDGPPPEEQKPRLVRPMGTAIHPARYTTEAMHRIRKNLYAAGQQRVWNALYQQNPAPDDGLFFTRDMFRHYPVLPHRSKVHVYQAWDFAITEGTESDYTVGATVFQDENDTLYVADIRRFKSADGMMIIDEIIDYALEWDATIVGFEDGQIWKALETSYQRRCEERRHYPSYEVLKPLTDKLVRASPLRGRMQIGKVYFDEKAAWYRDLFMEMTRFPAGKHDDQIDALAWTIRLILLHNAPRSAVRETRLPSWKDRLPGIGTGSAGHMAA